jgi:hypothetical protein
VQRLYERPFIAKTELTTFQTDRYRKLVAWQKHMSSVCAGPKCHPLLGNLPEMIKAKGFSQEFFEGLHEE